MVFTTLDDDFVQEAGYALIAQYVMAEFLSQTQAEFDTSKYVLKVTMNSA